MTTFPWRRAARLDRVVAAAGIAVVIGCGGGGGDDGVGPIPTECVDIGGSWSVDESADLDCDGFLDSFLPGSISGFGSIDLRQSGCALAYNVPESGIERRGTIDGTFVRLTGPIAVVPGIEGVRVIENFLTIEGDVGGTDPSAFQLTGSGALTVEFDGETSSCRVTSTADFDR